MTAITVKNIHRLKDTRNWQILTNGVGRSTKEKGSWLLVESIFQNRGMCQYLYVWVHACVLSACMYVCMLTFMLHTCMFVCLFACMDVPPSMYVCVLACIQCVYVCIKQAYFLRVFRPPAFWLAPIARVFVALNTCAHVRARVKICVWQQSMRNRKTETKKTLRADKEEGNMKYEGCSRSARLEETESEWMWYREWRRRKRCEAERVRKKGSARKHLFEGLDRLMAFLLVDLAFVEGDICERVWASNFLDVSSSSRHLWGVFVASQHLGVGKSYEFQFE